MKATAMVAHIATAKQPAESAKGVVHAVIGLVTTSFVGGLMANVVFKWLWHRLRNK
jgi:hypothetical protein